MKKIFLIIIAVMLVFTTPIHAFQIDINNNNVDVTKVAYINNLKKDSTSLKTNSIDKGKYEIEENNVEFDIHNKITIAGCVTGKSFSITTKPIINNINKNVISLEGSDEYDNFEILYFDVEKEILLSSKYFDDFQQENYNFIVKLYLKPINSSDIVIIEIFSNENKLYSYFENTEIEKSNKYEHTSDKTKQFWYAKIFEPKLKIIESESLNSNCKILDDKPNRTIYKYVFNHLGMEVEQYFIVSHVISYPDSFNNTGFFQTSLNVDGEYTIVKNYPNQNSDDTFLSISCVNIDIAIDEGDALCGYLIDGEVKKVANANIAFKYNNLHLFGPVSIELNYTNSNNDCDLNKYYKCFKNSLNNYKRQASVEMGTGYNLENEGHSFFVRWEIGNYSGVKYNQALKVKFRYKLTNRHDYLHWTNGNKFLNDTIFYNTGK